MIAHAEFASSLLVGVNLILFACDPRSCGIRVGAGQESVLSHPALILNTRGTGAVGVDPLTVTPSHLGRIPSKEDVVITPTTVQPSTTGSVFSTRCSEPWRLSSTFPSEVWTVFPFTTERNEASHAHMHTQVLRRACAQSHPHTRTCTPHLLLFLPSPEPSL